MNQNLTIVEDGKNVLAMIEKMSTNPDVDVEKMERVVALMEKIHEKQSIIAYNDAMVEVQTAIPEIVATGYNLHTKSKYAKLEDVNSAVKPIYTAHGFSLLFGMADSPYEGYFRTTCNIKHSAGYSEKYFVDLPLDLKGAQGTQNKSEVHATGSTMSYGRRYLICMIFNITISDEDNDGNGIKAPNDYELAENERKEIMKTLNKMPATERVPFIGELNLAPREGHDSLEDYQDLHKKIRNKLSILEKEGKL